MAVFTRERVSFWIFVCVYLGINIALFGMKVGAVLPLRDMEFKDLETKNTHASNTNGNVTMNTQFPVNVSDPTDFTDSSTITPKNGEDINIDNISVAPIPGPPAEYKLPQLWTKFCTVFQNATYESVFTPKMNMTSIKCTVTAKYSGLWTMADLRENLQLYKDSNRSFDVTIHCRSVSNVSLSWPFKVDTLTRFEVRDCVILDFLAEHGTEYVEKTPDSLRVLKMWNCKIVVSITRLIEMTKNIKHVSKSFDCGQHATIEDMSTRNVSYDFLEDLKYILTKLTEHGADFVLDTHRITHKCDFQHLMYMDESHSSSRSVYHMDLMTDSSIYYQLRTYNVSYNYIKVLQDQHLEWSRHFPNLDLLDISHNNVSKLYQFAVPLRTNLDKITTVNLQYNQISTISVNDLDRFKQMPMVFIDLRNNHMNCNCSETLKELLKYIKAGRHLHISNLSDYRYLENLECRIPEKLSGRLLKSLTSDMICEAVVQTEYFLVPIICLSAAIVVLALLLYMFLRFRQEITIILFTRFNIIIPCQTRENYDSVKKYDAFVSYSSNEEEYVEQLFEDLEKLGDKSGPSFKFCMHHRDFVPGRTIFDNVTLSVESSRHTIILLSNHFIKSEFCLYEFQEAFRQSIMEKKRHLVIVMMEDIPEERLPRDLRRCVKTFTYIRKDDFLFTERLIYALSIKHKGKTVVKDTHKSPKEKNIDSYKHYTKSKSNLNERIRSSGNKPTSVSPKTEIKTIGISNGLKCSNMGDDKIEQNDSVMCDTTVLKDKADSTRNITDGINKKCESVLCQTSALMEPTYSNNIETQQRYKKKKKTINSSNGKLLMNMKQTSDSNLSPVERKLNNKDIDYDRSISLISQDTGYGSDRSSLGEKLSPDVSVDLELFPEHAATN